MDPNSENAFPEGIFLTKLGIYQDYSKTLILTLKCLSYFSLPFGHKGGPLGPIHF